EELRVPRDGAGPSALDAGHSQFVQECGDRELIGDREVHALLLGAVAQRGVVDLHGVGGGCITHCVVTSMPVGGTEPGGRPGGTGSWSRSAILRGGRVCLTQQKDPPKVREVCAFTW